MKSINVYPIKTQIKMFGDIIGIICGIEIKPEGLIYQIEYFADDTLNSIKLYDFQLEYMIVEQEKIQKIGFKK
jgi:hypothetical protein